MAKMKSSIPGYKIVLRILLILLVAGGIGTLVFYFTGGFENNKKAYELCGNNLNQTQTTYFNENYKKGSDAYYFSKANITNFEKWYNAYESEKCVFDQLMPKLYFSSSNSKDLNGRISNYFNNLFQTSRHIQIFLEKKAIFDEGGLSSDEITRLIPLANNTFVQFKSQVKQMSLMNNSLIDFTKKYCVGSGEASLKETMIFLLQSQADVLITCLDNPSENLNKVTSDNNNGILKFTNLEANNFLKQTEEGSNEFNLVLTFDKITQKNKTNFLKAEDKDQFLETLILTSNDRKYLGYVKNVMGWGD